MPWPSVGELFENRYRLDTLLGEGGQASVFGATDRQAGRPVALKLLKRVGAHYPPDVEARFRRELGIIAGLSDPHTVKLFDYGRTADGFLYTVFEHVPGRDLDQILDEVGRLEATVVAHILWQLLNSLREAHAQGVVHRDLKPENVRVFDYGGDPWRVKLLDFGIARGAFVEQRDVTKTGTLVGTPRYMSPEQLTERPVGPTSDLYSLGVIGVELLAGRDALPGHRWGDQLQRIVPGFELTASLAGVDPRLRDVLGRLTAVDPARRFRDAGEALRALTDSVSAPIAAPRQAPPSGPNQVPPSGPNLAPPSGPNQAPPSGPNQAPALSRPGVQARPPAVHVAAALIAAVIVAAIVAAVLYFRTREPARSEPPAAARSHAEIARIGAATPASPTPGPDDIAAAAVDVGGAGSPEDVGAPANGCGLEPPGRQHVDLETADGRNWSAWIPASYDPNVPAPVVMLFHSANSTAMRAMLATELGEQAERHGFVLIAPLDDFDDYAWREPRRFRVATDGLDVARGQLCLDEDRIFGLGLGNGGRPVEALRCDGVFDAIATVSYRPDEGETTCAAAVPTLHLAPLEDCNYPIGNGRDCNWFYHKVSLDDKEADFRRFHRCTGERRVVDKPSGATCYSWSCEVPVVTCEVEGGPQWAGAGRVKGAEPLDPERGGRMKLAAGDYIWKFFDKHVTARGAR